MSQLAAPDTLTRRYTNGFSHALNRRSAASSSTQIRRRTRGHNPTLGKSPVPIGSVIDVVADVPVLRMVSRVPAAHVDTAQVRVLTVEVAVPHVEPKLRRWFEMVAADRDLLAVLQLTEPQMVTEVVGIGRGGDTEHEGGECCDDAAEQFLHDGFLLSVERGRIVVRGDVRIREQRHDRCKQLWHRFED